VAIALKQCVGTFGTESQVSHGMALTPRRRGTTGKLPSLNWMNWKEQVGFIFRKKLVVFHRTKDI
jgi:hypothetical protein